MNILLVTAGLLMATNLHAAEQAYISWVEVDESRQSYVYVYIVDSYLCLPWQPVAQSSDYLATPVVTRNKDGLVLASWKSANADFTSSNIQYSIQKGKQWSTPQAAISALGEVTNPAMISDLSGVTWLFWVSDQHDSDDIYVSHYDALMAKWSAPKLVHDRNTVPDIKPRVQINRDGFVDVTWQRYNATEGQYQHHVKTFAQPSQGGQQELAKPQFSIEGLVFPSQWRPSGSVNIHFPNNYENRHVHLSHSQALAYSPARSGQ